MNPIRCITCAGFILISIVSYPQSSDKTTYFAEKNGFQLDFPSDWKVSIGEKKAFIGTALTMIGEHPGNEFNIVMVTSDVGGGGCRNSKDALDGFISIYKKDAKKDGDVNFKINEEGSGVRADGKKFNYIDFTYTFKLNDGRSEVTRKRHYAVCSWVKANKYRNFFYFQAKESDWPVINPIYEGIFNSVVFK